MACRSDFQRLLRLKYIIHWIFILAKKLSKILCVNTNRSTSYALAMAGVAIHRPPAQATRRSRESRQASLGGATASQSALWASNAPFFVRFGLADPRRCSHA